MKNSLRIHKWTHNEFNIFILGVLTHPHLIKQHWKLSLQCSLPIIMRYLDDQSQLMNVFFI